MQNSKKIIYNRFWNAENPLLSIYNTLALLLITSLFLHILLMHRQQLSLSASLLINIVLLTITSFYIYFGILSKIVAIVLLPDRFAVATLYEMLRKKELRWFPRSWAGPIKQTAEEISIIFHDDVIILNKKDQWTDFEALRTYFSNPYKF